MIVYTITAYEEGGPETIFTDQSIGGVIEKAEAAGEWYGWLLDISDVDAEGVC